MNTPDVTFFMPRTDFSHREDYDLLDCILVSAGAMDEGICELGQHSFRKYYLGPEACLGLPADFQDPAKDIGNITGKLALYTKREIDESTTWRLSTYGVNFTSIASAGDSVLYQYAVDRRHLPHLARLCQNGVNPSRRMVEEHSYFKFIERGCHNGMDVADWMTAEWECQERIKRMLSVLGA